MAHIVERLDGQYEANILRGMILSDELLGRLATHWPREGCFKSSFANVVASWCLEHFHETGKAPHRYIADYYHRWSRNGRDEAQADLIERLLRNLHLDRKAEIDVDYLWRMSQRYFQRVQLFKLTSELEDALSVGQDARAMQAVEEFSRLDWDGHADFDLLHDEESLIASFEAVLEPVIRYPGDLGAFFGNSLRPDVLFTFVAPTGRYKSWWLMDFAWRAAVARQRVAFFECGDLSKAQVIHRFAVRAAGKPMHASSVLYPTSLTVVPDGNGSSRVETTSKVLSFADDLDWPEAMRAFEKIACRRIRSESTYLRLSVHETNSIGAGDIAAALAQWARHGWQPNLVCIDYPDILVHPAGRWDEREAINRTWMKLRAISQKFRCLVAVATQSDAAGYDVNLLKLRNFSDCRKKWDHARYVVGINAGEQGICRLNWIKCFDRPYDTGKCIWVASCLDLGRIAVRSSF